MDAHATPEVVQFDQFRLDRRVGRLLRRGGEGEFEAVSIGSRAIAVLCTLVDHGGDLVSKDEIMAAAWPDTVVEESNLTVQISALRRVLDHGRHGGSCIQTVSGRGYRFVPPVESAEEMSAALARPHQSAPLPPPPGHWTKAVIAGATGLAVLLGAGGWWMLRSNAPSRSTAVLGTQASDRRGSAIVLPFENGSGDPAQDGRAAALTRDLTDRLALGGLVVPAVTASAYRGKSVDLRDVGRKYDIHFALVGNVRRQAERVILSATVYDIVDGQPIWSRQFNLPDGSDAWSGLVQNIYEGYWQASVDAEAYRAVRDHPGRLDKRDLMSVELSTRLTAPTKEHFVEKMSLVDRVLAIDANDFQALERQARLHAEFVLLGYSSNTAADLLVAERASDRLLAMDPNNLLALRARTAVLRAQGDWPAAEAVVRRAIALQPTEAVRHYELGFILAGAGRYQEALQSFQAAKRFAGGADPVYLFDANIAMASLAIGHLADAIAMARASISEFPPDTGRISELPWLVLIAATSDSGRDDEARADLRTFLTTRRSWHSMSQIQKWPSFVANRNLLEGLRGAGMQIQ